MTNKWIAIAGATAILTLGLGTGLAAAQSDDNSPTQPVTSISHHDDHTPDQMHDNTDGQCDAAHAEHQQMMSGDMMTRQMMDNDMMTDG